MTVNIYSHSPEDFTTLFITDNKNETSDSSQIISETHYHDSYKKRVANLYKSDLNYPKENYFGFEKLSSLISEIYSVPQVTHDNSGIIPPGLLYISSKSNLNSYLIFERPPSYQIVELIPRLMEEINYNRDEIYTYRLPVPWQVYFVKFSSIEPTVKNPEKSFYVTDVRMFFASQPVQTFDDHVYLPPLTNFYINGELCRPLFSKMSDTEPNSNDVAGMMQMAYDWIWQSGSNIDLTNCITQYFIQLKNKTDKTVLTKVKDPKQKFELQRTFAKYSISNYYTTFDDVYRLYSAWEEFSLDEVLELSWPAPHLERTLSNFISELTHKYSNSYREYRASLLDNSDSHCEYYPECDSDECDCSEGYIEYSTEEFLTWTGHWPLKPSSIKTMFDDFITETYQQQYLPRYEFLEESVKNKILHQT